MHLFQTALLGWITTVAVGLVYVAHGEFEWDENLQTGFAFLSVTTTLEVFAFLVFGLLVRTAFVYRASRLVAAIAMAVANLILWPIQAAELITAVLIVAAIAVVAGWLTAVFLARRDETRTKRAT